MYSIIMIFIITEPEGGAPATADHVRAAPAYKFGHLYVFYLSMHAYTYNYKGLDVCIYIQLQGPLCII